MRHHRACRITQPLGANRYLCSAWNTQQREGCHGAELWRSRMPVYKKELAWVPEAVRECVEESRERIYIKMRWTQGCRAEEALRSVGCAVLAARQRLKKNVGKIDTEAVLRRVTKQPLWKHQRRHIARVPGRQALVCGSAGTVTDTTKMAGSIPVFGGVSTVAGTEPNIYSGPVMGTDRLQSQPFFLTTGKWLGNLSLTKQGRINSYWGSAYEGRQDANP
ncbi:hypothetical protein NLG97_g2902 [Lecanicillium saksenae]|uniref:Uncharacterized protein n=1 Tax=Lecanicillium saksenae TaxID=468837 RepID=A0ACC1R1A1_9HYPO|nr:hypothetical protein NLG97_g2902 [Lecanicillium saksenae]